jgi:hypothetical protein
MPHPLSLSILELRYAYCALAGKFSFMIVKQDDGKWYTSWQDRKNGGSASNTIEGPFLGRDKAEANCRHIFKSLQQKQ